MNQDKWTQQLHDKLAEHEIAPPEGLWDDIEAALGQSSKPQKARFVSLRRWAVAASVTALLIGGAYLWFDRNDMRQESYESLSSVREADEDHSPLTAQVSQVSKAERSLVPEKVVKTSQPLVSSESEDVAEVLEPSVSPVSDAVKKISDAVEKVSDAEEKVSEAMAETSESQPLSNPDMVAIASKLDVPAESDRIDVPVCREKKSPDMGLFAMNGFGAQTNSNGVQMAKSMAENYAHDYMGSDVAYAKSDGTIYLTGFEERQHHHRPVSYGLTLSYPLSERFSLTTGVTYTKLFSEFTKIMRRQRIEQEQTLHYVGIPVGVSYRLWNYKGLKTYLSAGVKADINVATHLETEGVSQELAKDRLQWSFSGSVGVQYEVLPQVGIYAEPALSAYPDNGSPLQNYFKDKPLNWNLQVGLRVNFRQ